MKHQLLKINMSNRSFEIEDIPKEVIRKYIGGRGLGAYLLYQSVPPKADPLGEENHLIFTAGPASGSGLFYSSKVNLNTKSPLTGIYLYSISSGILAQQMRKAGFWAIDITGIAESSVYLVIENRKVLFKDAGLLMGMKTAEAQECMLKDASFKNAATIAIGPAGEQLNRYAAVFADGPLYRCFGRGGGGAVMGSKNLKGMVVAGNEDLNIGDKQKFERVQKENLELKLSLIEELKNLIDNAEPSSMYKEFKNLQDRWREVGQIPHGKYNDVWRTYHHHVERFYDLLHLNNDFRDLDFKHNFEEKSKLIEKAEALSGEEDVNHAFKELQLLHRMWKEDIGPVAREFREEVWHKFSEATKKIHKRRHAYQDKLDEKFKANVDLKLAVIDKIKSIDIEKNQNHKDWQASIKKLEALRDEFFGIGKVPKAKNEEIWQLFREATRDFNAKKNNFYKSIKKDQVENLKKKMTLVEQAESLKDSEEWDIATEVFKKVQAEWKKIGHVPRQDSDKIWKRFKDAF